MKSLIYPVFLVSLFMAAQQVQAQGDVRFSGHAGVALPNSEFGDDDFSDDDSGLAAPGLTVGIKLTKPLGDNGFGLFGGIDVMYNPLQADARDDIEDANPDTDFTFFRYITVPLSAGFDYHFDAGDGVQLFGQAGIAFSFVKVTNFVRDDEFEELTSTHELANNVGFTIGAGAVINDHIIVGLSLFNLGDHDIDGETESSEFTDTNEFDFEQSISTLNLTVGIMFN
ncbi:MAG: outer membrane beta-barrel protein [Bacteroidota bacterium]